MKRRGFLTAILGLFAWPVIGKVKVKSVENTWIRDAARRDSFMHNIFPVEKISERDALNERIRNARENYFIGYGNYPNIILLGKDEYVIWTKDHDEVWGEADGWCDDPLLSQIPVTYPTAYGMIVQHKTHTAPDAWEGCLEKAHLSVANSTKIVFNGVYEKVMKTRGFKV